jgi:rod shape determining protein RodA
MLSKKFFKEKKGFRKFLEKIDWITSISLMVIASIAIVMLISAAGNSWSPWALNHLLRFIIGFMIMSFMGCIPIKWFYKTAYGFYAITLLLLAAVDLMGNIRKGAERWIDLGFMQLQPSEIAKISLILALAKFYHYALHSRLSLVFHILIPFLLILLPVILILAQPDLGTAVLLLGGGAVIMFLAGIPWWFFAGGLLMVIGMTGIIWQKMHDYQKTRVTIFLNPEQDPLGKGYHIMQSKIAMGSGGFWGKGLMKGTQTQLDFLPEKHTDFAFTAFTEQLGFVGAITLIFLFICLLLKMMSIALKTDYWFGRLLAMGLAMNLFFHVFVNMGMVMGILPVVGIPLPFFSYGGTSMLSLLFGFGLLMSIQNSKEL